MLLETSFFGMVRSIFRYRLGVTHECDRQTDRRIANAALHYFARPMMMMMMMMMILVTMATMTKSLRFIRTQEEYARRMANNVDLP